MRQENEFPKLLPFVKQIHTLASQVGLSEFSHFDTANRPTPSQLLALSHLLASANDAATEYLEQLSDWPYEPRMLFYHACQLTSKVVWAADPNDIAAEVRLSIVKSLVGFSRFTAVRPQDAEKRNREALANLFTVCELAELAEYAAEEARSLGLPHSTEFVRRCADTAARFRKG